MSKVKPEKLTLLDRKEHQSLHNFAQSLETIAARLKEDARVTFKEGDKDTIINPNTSVKVEYKYVTQGSKHKFEIELKWDDEAPEDFTIQ